MSHLHDKTNHSYMSIRKNANFLDWRTQPKNFKTYPHFQQRFKIDDYPELKNLNLIGGITFEKEYPEGKYYLRTNPSAGALYPCEIYIQLRGISGLISGVYHYEPHSKSLCLLQEIDADGVEYYFKDNSKQKGITFLISSIYFRSSWKYRDRSIRYIFLDSGHTLGTIYAALCVMDKESQIMFDFDKLALNEVFGFRNDEMFTCAISATTPTDKETKPLRQQFPFVSGCDFLETNNFIENEYKQTAEYRCEDITNLTFFDSVSKEQLKSAILNRRSIRAFRELTIEENDFAFILENIFTFGITHNIDIFYTIHRVNGMTQGLYKNGTLQSIGDFSAKSRYLSLEQNLGGQSAVTFYFTSNEIEAYQKVNILSGFLAQIIYLKSELKQVGCSGIGAYYDEETKEFLKTENNILYLLAIGK
jgi:SagB-type dehydrogenase family enzyme